jgi:hypothetical protein
VSFLTAAGSAGSILGNLFSSSSTNTSSNTNTSLNQSGTSTGTTSRNLTPGQTALSGPLFSYIQQLMTPGGAQAAVAPFTAASMDSTNSAYSGLANTLRSQFLSTGNGQSGKYGTAMVQGNLQRLGALQGVQTAGQEEAEQLPLQASELGEQLLGMNFGQTQTGATTSTAAGTSATTGSSSTSGFKI